MTGLLFLQWNFDSITIKFNFYKFYQGVINLMNGLTLARAAPVLTPR